MDPQTRLGFILHCYHRVHKGREHIYAIGCLAGNESGESFGIVVQNFRPHFYIEINDLQAAQAVLNNSNIGSIHNIADDDYHTLHGAEVLSVSAETQHSLRHLRQALSTAGVATFEADLSSSTAWLIENDIRGAIEIHGHWQTGTTVDHLIYNPRIQPSIHTIDCSVLSIDIETSYNGDDDKNDDKNNEKNDHCTAISFVGIGARTKNHIRSVYILDKNNTINEETIHSFATERAMLQAFAATILRVDPDIITGWNVIDFDFQFLQQRFEKYKVPWLLGRSQDLCAYRPGKRWGSSKMFIPGRQVLDGMHLIRHTLTRYQDYTLDSIASAVLGRGKLLHGDNADDMLHNIQDAYANDKKLFAEYCLEDAQLVLDILKAEDLLTLTIQRSSLTGLSLERAWGSVAAFEFLYMSELHKRRIVLRTASEVEHLNDGAPGGYVFQPKVGLYDNIFVFDFKSLYPSIIRTFNIDPLSHARSTEANNEAILTAPNGARFLRQRGILPDLLDVFFDKRAEAKAADNDLASYTYKIVMNSFYGVLGSGGCRLAHPELAGAITSFGHLLLKWCRSTLEEYGYEVLYGDTDSVFVDAHVDKIHSDSDKCSIDDMHKIADKVCVRINDALTLFIRENYAVTSQLELEFEKHYHTLLLPPSRGDQDIGRAKGYAGLLYDADSDQQGKVDIVGLEAVRRDWTDLAHNFQRHLFDLLFHKATSEDIESFMSQTVRDLYHGKKDNELVYRRALRKPLEEYTKTTPPHVKAARLLDHPSGLISYLITTQGPQPLSALSAAIDYDHYLSKQIEPIVQVIAGFCEVDVARALHGEQRLF